MCWVEQLTWLAATCRPLAVAEPHYSIVSSNKGLSENHIVVKPCTPLYRVDKGCWRTVFGNMPVAYGYPIPDRPDGFRESLELPFELMTLLAGIRFPMTWREGIVLMGYSAILIPILSCGDCLLWHLVRSTDRHHQIHLEDLNSDNETVNFDGEFYRAETLDCLSRRRTFLGFSPQIKVHLGTTRREIEPSRVPYESASAHLASLSASVGSEGLGFAGAHFGPNISICRSLRANALSIPININDRLIRARDQPLLMYDLTTKRGFLIPEISALFHLVLSWSTRHELLNAIPFAPATADNGRAVHDTIQGNASLVLQETSDGEVVTLIDKVKQFLEQLDNLKEAQFGRMTEGPRLSFLRQRSLLCWDCCDILELKSFPRRRKLRISKSLLANQWPKILCQSPDMLTLVCKGLGEIVTNAVAAQLCNICATPPVDCYCVVATIRCLLSIPRETWECCNLQWASPHGHKPFESCQRQFRGNSQRLQILKRQRDGDFPWTNHEDGALLFVEPQRQLRSRCELSDRRVTDIYPASGHEGSPTRCQNNSLTVPVHVSHGDTYHIGQAQSQLHSRINAAAETGTSQTSVRA